MARNKNRPLILSQVYEDIELGDVMDKSIYVTNSNTSHNATDKPQLGKGMALKQIHMFMDSYQRDILVKLSLDTADDNPPNKLVSAAGKDHNHNTYQTVSSAKQQRYQLHKTWLAHKPAFKPATAF